MWWCEPYTHTMIQPFSMREHHFGICALCSNLLQHYTYYTPNTLAYQQLQLGSVSYKMSLTLCVMMSGNLISNETIRSPFRLGSFGNGSPWPWIRFTVVGFTISFMRLTGILSPVSVGILTTEPHKACNKKCFQFIIYSNYLLLTTERSSTDWPPPSSTSCYAWYSSILPYISLSHVAFLLTQYC